MVAAATRSCMGCKRPLPLGPIPRYHVCEDCGWEPAPVEVSPGVWSERGPQAEFLSSPAFEVGFGGAAGGGKSESLLMDAMRDVKHPQYRALLLRRTIREMRRSLIDRALHGWYNRVAPGGFVGSPSPLWRFPSGAIIEFGNLETEGDLENYQSAEYQYIGFDELCHFTRKMYTYMLSRLRSSHGIKSRVRSGFNPPADMTGAWVVQHFAPWVDRGPDYHGVRVESGESLHVIASRDGGEQYVPKGTIDEEGNAATARVFIAARIKHNPYIDKKDPMYRSRLLKLDPVTRAQLLDGDFSRMDKPGALWQRAVINAGRVTSHPVLYRIGVGLDPSGSHRKGSDEAGIVRAGLGPCFCNRVKNARGELVREEHVFVYRDDSGVLPATQQARRAIAAYHEDAADFVAAEINYGGEWIAATIAEIDDVELEDGRKVSGRTVNVAVEHVSKGKVVRAEPVAALYGKLNDYGELEGCKVHHVGEFAGLENEMCTYDPRVTISLSPGRMDALVFVVSKLMLGEETDGADGVHSEGERRISSRQSGFMP